MWGSDVLKVGFLLLYLMNGDFNWTDFFEVRT